MPPHYNMPPGPAAGKGRPKGRLNNQTLEQRAFAARVCYGQDGQGKKDFEEHCRKALLAGSLPPGIQLLIFHYLLGRPVERIELKTDEREFEALTTEQIRARAMAIATGGSTPSGGDTEPTTEGVH